MRKLTSLMALMTILVVMTVSATDDVTTIWTDVVNTGGYTEFVQYTEVYEYVPKVFWWGSGKHELTGTITEGFVNDGSFELHSVMTSYDDGELVELKQIWGEGNTEIYKTVTIQSVQPWKWPFWGDLWFPAEAYVETTFVTDEILDVTNVYLLQPELGTTGTFSKIITTNDDFNFYERVGINTEFCDYTGPEPPKSPEFFCPW